MRAARVSTALVTGLPRRARPRAGRARRAGSASAPAPLPAGSTAIDRRAPGRAARRRPPPRRQPATRARWQSVTTSASSGASTTSAPSGPARTAGRRAAVQHRPDRRPPGHLPAAGLRRGRGRVRARRRLDRVRRPDRQRRHDRQRRQDRHRAAGHAAGVRRRPARPHRRLVPARLERGRRHGPEVHAVGGLPHRRLRRRHARCRREHPGRHPAERGRQRPRRPARLLHGDPAAVGHLELHPVHGRRHRPVPRRAPTCARPWTRRTSP